MSPAPPSAEAPAEASSGSGSRRLIFFSGRPNLRPAVICFFARFADEIAARRKRNKVFYGPGIFVLGLSMFPPLLAALAMAKEGEQQTILQVYVSSISAHEFLLGKIPRDPYS